MVLKNVGHLKKARQTSRAKLNIGNIVCVPVYVLRENHTFLSVVFSFLSYTSLVQLNLHDLLAADHLVAVEPLGQHSERGLDDATTQTQHQMKSGL